jgi:pyridoxal phosphate phosphatase PHOSPHO2
LTTAAAGSTHTGTVLYYNIKTIDHTMTAKNNDSALPTGTAETFEDCIGTATGSSSRTCVIFDYDWSLINDNSDTLIFEKLFSEQPDILQRLYRKGMQWMAAVDHALLMLQTSQNLPVKTLQETVANVPIQKYMIDAVRYASSKESTDLHIVSDANTAYIGACLQKHNLSSCFTEIVTNPAYEDEGGRLRVKPFHNQPHLCPYCPTNMCKSDILENVLNIKQRYDRVIYIGDGAGDFCPSIRLTRPNDCVLARAADSKRQ